VRSAIQKLSLRVVKDNPCSNANPEMSAPAGIWSPEMSLDENRAQIAQQEAPKDAKGATVIPGSDHAITRLADRSNSFFNPSEPRLTLISKGLGGSLAVIDTVEVRSSSLLLPTISFNHLASVSRAE
jgi:hypothetical protein